MRKTKRRVDFRQRLQAVQRGQLQKVTRCQAHWNAPRPSYAGWWAAEPRRVNWLGRYSAADEAVVAAGDAAGAA